jgi:hypothetical protein
VIFSPSWRQHRLTQTPDPSLHFPADRVIVVEIARHLVCVVTMRRLISMLSACLGACGDNVVVPPDARPDAMSFAPAPHIPMPQVFEHAGTVLTNVQLVTITFDGYSARDEVEAFGDTIVASNWYQAVGAEYKVETGLHVQKAHLGAAPASLTREEVKTRIVDLITRRLVPTPPAKDNQLLYLLYVPPEVAFAGPGPARPGGSGGSRSYHEMARLDSGVRFPVAVVVDDGTGLAALTVAAAHQLIEAATDPYEAPNDGYYTDPPMDDPWSLVSGEVADLCEGEDTVTDLGYMLPRVYSNRAAIAGTTPCLPAGPDDAWNDVSAEPWQMQRIEPGHSVTFELTGWSTRELPAWALRTQVAERSDLTEAEMMPEMSSDMINNMTTVNLTLHAPARALPGTIGGINVLSGRNVRPWAIGFIVK